VPICAPTTHRTARRSSLQCCCRPPRFSPLSSRPLATRKEPTRPRPSTLDSAARTTSPARRHCTSRSRRAKMPWSRCCSSTAHKSTRKPMSLDNRVPHHSTLHADCMYLTDHPLPSHHHVAHNMLSLSLSHSSSGHRNIVRTLVLAGADDSILDYAGKSPLETASYGMDIVLEDAQVGTASWLPLPLPLPLLLLLSCLEALVND